MLLLISLLLLDPRLQRDPMLRQIRFPAQLYASHFNRPEGLANHHLIVWQEGKAAELALIQTEISDRDILQALKELGGKPGDNLGADAWLMRNNPLSKAPDQAVTGTRVALSLRINGREMGLDELIMDLGGKGYQFHLGGHEALIPLWRSGCVVCLESCPGGRISNARYTMRDLAAGRARFALKPNLPADGTAIEVVLTLVSEPVKSR